MTVVTNGRDSCVAEILPGVSVSPDGVLELCWTRFEEDLLTLCRRGRDVDAFVRTLDGVSLPLAWPPGARLYLVTADRLCVLPAELCELRSTYVCCSGFSLALLGLAVFAGGRRTLGVLVLLGECGEIYGYNGRVDDALYRLAEDPAGFRRRGLARYDPLYDLLSPWEDCPWMRGLVAVDDVVARALAGRGDRLPLAWPTGAVFVWDVPGDLARRWRVLPGGKLGFVLGRLAGDVTSRMRKQRILIDGRGRTYALDVESARVVRLAGSFHAFLLLGARRLVANFRLTSRGAALDRLPVTCVHVPVIELPDLYALPLRGEPLCPPYVEEFLSGDGSSGGSSSPACSSAQ